MWAALSTLFLDTDVSLLRDYRAKILSASPYGVADLETILAEEVFPLCIGNLFSVAGEWAAFNEDWLEQQITKHVSARFRLRLGIGFFFVRRSQEWRATRQAVERLRSADRRR
ncbi:MAG TPA: hypothetical protein VM115_12940 [Vicinamibacterales bacterium]|nr:hypothetical protein [Vicinamibacterales bacterium]